MGARTKRESRARDAGITLYTRLVNLLGGTEVSDIANGYRAIRASRLSEIAFTEDQFHNPELLLGAARAGLRVVDVPVTIRRRASGTSKKGTNLRYGLGLPSGDRQDLAAVGEGRAAARPGAIDLYRAGWTAVRDTTARLHVATLVEIALVAAYVLLRTTDATRPLLSAWVVAASTVAILAPSSGLVLLAAIAPFTEPFSLTRQLGVKPLLVAAVAAGVVARLAIEVAAGRPSRRDVIAALRRPSPAGIAIGASLVVLAGTALGIALTARTLGRAEADLAWQTWAGGIGAAFTLLLAGAWAGRRGDLRPLVVAVGAAVVGGVVSLADFLNATAVRDSAFGWLVRPNRFELRLTGIIPSPNGVAALLIVPVGLLAATALLARDRRLQALALAAVLPLGVALYFTYSRAALIGLFLIAVVVAWRLRRWLGAGLLAAGLVAAVVLLPSYLASRNAAVGGEGDVQDGEVLVASDALRFRAWGAASRMWLDEPIIGHGFLSYRTLHGQFGDPILRSPHNEWLRLFAEEGAIVGLAGLAFVAATAVALGRRRDVVSSGVLAGFLAFTVAATFNNPLLFVQVVAIAFPIVGIGLGRAMRAPPGEVRPGAGAA